MIKAEPITARELEKRQSRKRLLGCSLRWCCLPAVAAYLIAFVWSWTQWGIVTNPISPVFDVIGAVYGYAYRVGWIKLDHGPATCDSIELVDYDNQPVISFKTNVIGNQLRFAFLDSNTEESPATWQATNVLGDASFSWVETPQLAYINNGKPSIGYCLDGRNTYFFTARTALPGQPADWPNPEYLYGSNHVDGPMFIDLMDYQGKPAFAGAYTWEGYPSPATGNPAQMQQTYVQHLIYGRARTANSANSEDWLCLDFKVATDWQLVTVDGGDSTGFFCDLAEVNGCPAIAYCDVSEEALKLAWATAVQPATAADWDIQTVDDLAAIVPAEE